MRASTDVPASEIPSETGFAKFFARLPNCNTSRSRPEKKTFCRCSTCTRLAHAIDKARKSGNTQELVNKKTERVSRYRLERSDKLHDYRVRQRARSKTPTNLSVITDKMDGNKNKVPR